jgi:hypothetical protein
MRLPSRSTAGEAILRPSTHVPWLEPSSVMAGRPVRLSPRVTRACTRDTEGSSSWTEFPGARPIVSSWTSGTAVQSGSTSSKTPSRPFRSAPQLGQEAACRSSCRRHTLQSIDSSEHAHDPARETGCAGCERS